MAIYGPYMVMYGWPYRQAGTIRIDGRTGHTWTYMVTGMIEPKMGVKIVKQLIKKWDPEGCSGALVYESYVVFRAGSFYDSPEARF